jgi:hypothetical protein
MRGRWLSWLALGVGALVSTPTGADESPSVVVAYPRRCTQGLYLQPGNAFAALLFCDDAAGSSLGVLCYAGSACDQPPWQLASRFWQQEPWARDVTAFAWDPNRTCLYVSTSEIYSDGDLFALDLLKQKATRIPFQVQGRLQARGRYSTEILRINASKQQLEYRIQYFDAVAGAPRSEVAGIPLGRCGQM